MAENGEEKLIAVARHIAKTLGHSNTMTDDILKIFSSFDGRLREKLTEKLADDGVERIIDALEHKISPYVAADRPIWTGTADPAVFLESVDQLIGAARDWTPLADDKKISACLDRAEDLLQQSMFRLEEEFRTLAERGPESTQNESTHVNADFSDEEDDGFGDEDENFIPVAQPITDYDIVIDALPLGTIGDLHQIAKRMVAAGYMKECAHAYSSCRRDFLEESFSRLGLQKLSIDDVHKMQWTQLEDEIEKWMKAMNVAFRILFPSERRLCDRVFLGLSSAADLSFMEVCRGSTIQLLNFADAVAIGSRAPERLFKVLDVYETVRDLMPEFELIFSDQYCLPLRNEAITIWKRLGEAIRGIFMELENLIRRDPAKEPVPGGRMHPITRYVMNYLRAACRAKQTLEQVFEEAAAPTALSSSSSSLAVQIAWIMELLESNLEAKSKIYKDPALCSVFMMNNGRYIVQKAKDCELGSLLGEDWVRKHTAKVRQYLANYQRSSWSKILGFLKVDGIPSSPNEVSKTLKEKLKLFNSYFDEICKTQSSWVIFDDQLGDEVRGSIVGTVCPAYRGFIARLQSASDVSGKNADKHRRYSVDDVEAKISQLFRGASNGRRCDDLYHVRRLRLSKPKLDIFMYEDLLRIRGLKFRKPRLDIMHHDLHHIKGIKFHKPINAKLRRGKNRSI